MAISLADLPPNDLGTVHPAMGRSVTDHDIDSAADADGSTIAKGIGIAVLLATPFWALVVFTVYMLL